MAWLATSSLAAAATTLTAILLVVVCFIWPVAIMSLAFPATFVVRRVGPSVFDSSVADVVVFLAAIAALPFVPWRNRRFRDALFMTLGYGAVISLAVVNHPSLSAAIEVPHRFVMAMGAISVGAALAFLGRERGALRLLVAYAAAISVIAVIDSLSRHLGPAYPLTMQKNAGGFLLAASFLVLFLSHRRLGWPPWAVRLAGGLILIGLAATQSRGAILSLLLVFVVVALQHTWHQRLRRLRRAAPLILLAAIGLGTVGFLSFQSESALHQGSNYKFGSIGSRETTYRATFSQVIKPHPVFGAGPKWFREPDAPSVEPHNLLIDELSSVGLVGLAAFLIFLWALFRLCRRCDSPYAELAWTVLLLRVLATMVDVFWAAGPNTLPFLLIGLAIGAEARQHELRPELAAELVR